eukprot:g32064.t1
MSSARKRTAIIHSLPSVSSPSNLASKAEDFFPIFPSVRKAEDQAAKHKHDKHHAVARKFPSHKQYHPGGRRDL